MPAAASALDVVFGGASSLCMQEELGATGHSEPERLPMGEEDMELVAELASQLDIDQADGVGRTLRSDATVEESIACESPGSVVNVGQATPGPLVKAGEAVVDGRVEASAHLPPAASTVALASDLGRSQSRRRRGGKRRRGSNGEGGVADGSRAIGDEVKGAPEGQREASGAQGGLPSPLAGDPQQSFRSASFPSPDPFNNVAMTQSPPTAAVAASAFGLRPSAGGVSTRYVCKSSGWHGHGGSCKWGSS